MLEKLQRVKEQRLIEATKKNLIGPAGKIAIILKTFGSKMFAHEGDMCDVTYLSDPYDLIEEKQEIDFLTVRDAEDEQINIIGYYYDDLRNGTTLEIKYMDRLGSLTVRWHGNIVFQEIQGDLSAYNPNGYWQDRIEKLYDLAVPVAKRNRADLAEREEIEKKSTIEKIMKDLRMLWGI